MPITRPMSCWWAGVWRTRRTLSVGQVTARRAAQELHHCRHPGAGLVTRTISSISSLWPRRSGSSTKKDMITTIAVKVRDVSRIAAVSEEMEKIPDIQVVTMTQIMGTIMNLAGSARSLLLTVIAIALIISAFGIINTLLMSVNERTREFGMMKAIGASGLDIGKMVLAETVFITLAGGIIGTVAAIVGSSLIEGFVKGMLPYSPRGSLISLEPGAGRLCAGLLRGSGPGLRNLSGLQIVPADAHGSHPGWCGMSSIIEARSLSKVYRRGREEIHALKNVDFRVNEGEFVSIIGPSGSGKTALLNMLGCLDTPSGGSLRLNGIEISGLKERDLVKLRRENIGFVFQQFYLMPTLTARENIELPLLFSHKNGGKKRIDEVLQMVGLGGERRSPARTALRRRDAAGGHRPGPDQRSAHHPGG